MPLFGPAPPPTPPAPRADAIGWLIVLAAAIIAMERLGNAQRSLAAAWRAEFIGSFVMVLLTCTPGVWWDGEPVLGVPASWIFHAAGVVMTDWVCNGPHVNPSVSFSFFVLSMLDVKQLLVHVMAQVAGCTAAFHVCAALSNGLGWNQLSFPSVAPTLAGEALLHACACEVGGLFSLSAAVFSLNLEPPASVQARSPFYILKTVATAVAVRLILVAFSGGGTGPVINPALATGWEIYSTGTLPSPDEPFWLVYWYASLAGGLVAALAYALYTPQASAFGVTLRAMPKQKAS